MKYLQWLSLLAITPSSALSQSSPATNKDFTSVDALKSVSNVIPWACDQSDTVISNQLAEITRLKSRDIPVPHDLAGYLYAVIKGRKILGCPDLNPFNMQQNSSTPTQKLSERSTSSSGNSSSSEAAEVEKILCKPTRILQEDVMDQINVLKEYKIPVPDYLAGWWSVIKDANSFIKCGLQDMDIGQTGTPEAAD